MGMFLDDTAMLVIVAPLYVPLVDQLGFDLIWYGVLYTITCQIAYMTPPFGYNLFLMRAMAPPEITMGDIYRSIVPFVAADGAGADPDHGLPADRAVAAEASLRKMTSRPTGGPHRTTNKEMTDDDTRRKFLTTGAAGRCRRAGRTRRCSPQAAPIKWRLQTYAGAGAGRACDQALRSTRSTRSPRARWRSSCIYADQLVPTGELFRAMQKGTIDAVQSDDDFDGLARPK